MVPDHELLPSLLGRTQSLLAGDLARERPRIDSVVSGSRLLVVGAAGSVGRSFVRQLTGFRPRTLHLADVSENTLVEVVRDLRSSGAPLPEDFRTFTVALGSEEFRRLLDAEGPYDRLVNFAALKHVRSERDPYSLMRMVETNAGAMYDLLTDSEVSGRPPGFDRVFTVSTDKASHPASAMGATKRLMERVHLCHADRVPFSSARFANVAFSDGSLLDGWRHRIAKRQPLAAPSNIRRYFFSHEEAGQLCLLACFLGGNREIFFPRLEKDSHLITLRMAAERFLAAQGLEPWPCGSEEEALARAREMGSAPRRWPCLFVSAATSGEKPEEDFFAPDDDVDFGRFESIGVIRQPVDADRAAVEHAMTVLRAIRALPGWSKTAIIGALQVAVPEFAHRETGADLDQKM